MKKVLFCIFSVLFLSFLAFVQNSYGQSTYNNNWIDSSKVYSKITVSKKGFYSISIQELAKTDPSLLGAKPENLNLFFRGKSIAFEVIASGATLNGTDKIVFFGIPNDGKLETEMYRPASAQPHIFSSLYTKESNYYLVNNPTNPLINRVKNEIEVVAATDKVVQSQNYQIQKIYDTEFSFNSTVGPIPIVQQSYFEPGEGYTGRQIRTDEQAEFILDVKDAISGKGVVDIILNGRADIIRRIRIKVGNKDTIVTQAQFAHRAIRIPITFTGNTVKLVLSSPDDRYSLSLFKLTYDSKIVSSAENSVFVNANTTGTLKVTEGVAGQPKIYNVTDPYDIKNAKFLSKESTIFNYLISATGTTANEYYYSQTYLAPEKITAFKPSTLKLKNEANYIIISHKNLLVSAKKYKEFRESDLGGLFDVDLVFIDDIYDHFNFGIKSPQAIRNFLFMKLNEGAPANLLLLGKAFSAHTGTNGPDDLVPSWGYPASDLLLSAGIVTKPDVNGISTGRIPALTDAEVMAYLEKLKRNLKLPNDSERKSMLHFSGGRTFEEIGHFGDIMDSLASSAVKSDFGVSLESSRKPKPGSLEPYSVSGKFNAGLSLVSFFGHSSYTTLDYNPGFVTNPELGYNNTRCPVLFYNGCAYNNYFREIKTQSQDWILAANKGAIGILGQSYYGYESALNKHAQKLYETIFYSDEEPTLGEALRITAEKVANLSTFGQLDILNNCQTLLFGDPAVKIFGFDKPDLLIDSATFKNQVAGNTRTVSFTLLNTGKKIAKDKISIKFIQEGLPENIVKTLTIVSPKISEKVSISLPNINVFSKLRVQIDYDNAVNEGNEDNNVYEVIEGGIKITKDQSGPFVAAKLDKQEPYDLMTVSNKPILELLVKDNTPLIKKGKNNTTIYGFTKACEECEYVKLDLSKLQTKYSAKDSSTLVYEIQLGDYKPGEYFVLFYAADSAKNIDFDNPVKISFQVVDTGSPSFEMVLYPNPSAKCVTFRIGDFSSFVKGNVSFYLASVKGSKVAEFTKPIFAGKTKIDYCFDRPGVYVYRIKLDVAADKPKTFTGKFIITE
jgi:Peptidase family C25/CARDB